MFDMWRVFEDFVTTALAEALRSVGGRSEPQKPVSLDMREQVLMRPDLLWYRDGIVRAVVDAKYKAEKPEGFPNADIYQMLAYCTVLGLPQGHLIYAKGNEPALAHSIRRTGVVIHCHALDLGAPPAALLKQVGELAEGITASVAAA